MTIFRKFAICVSVFFALLASSILYNPPITSADTAQYFYDGIGRLTQVVNGSNITNYNYDEVGNILSVTNGSLSSIPSIVSVSPTTLLVGIKTPVVFSGQNLLSAGTVSSLNNNIVINNVVVEANKITVLVTAQNTATDTIKIVFRDNASTVYQANFDAVAATVTVTPSLFIIPPNTTVTAVISLNPPLLYPVTIGLRASNATVATVPTTVTIPPGEAIPIQINTLSAGFSTITNLNNIEYIRVVSEKPVDGNGITSMPVSVMIMPAVSIPPGDNISAPVSVLLMPAVQTPAPSAKVAAPVSVAIYPSAATITPSATVSKPVSVKISQ